MNKITIIKVPKGGVLDSLLSGSAAAWLDSYLGYFWLIIAILFLFAELNTPGLFFFVSFATGAFCASILAFLGYPFFMQCMVGLAVSMVSFFVMRRFLKRKKMSEVEYGSSITNIDALVGKKGVVTREIKPHFKGLVKVRGESWGARGAKDVALKKGDVVSVARVEGNTIIVKPLDSGESNGDA